MKETIIELLTSTKIDGMDRLIAYMDKQGFFTAPCSGAYHLCKEGGLAEHSLNVFKVAIELDKALKADTDYTDLVIVSLLHDLGKMGDFDKPNYVPNFVRSKTKNEETGDYDLVISTAKPYTTNPELLYVDHEIRSIAIAERFIKLTEEQERAILLHNGLYGVFGYQLKSSKQTPLEFIIHWADLFCSRIIEEKDGQD